MHKLNLIRNFLLREIRNLLFYSLWIIPLLFLFAWHVNFVSPAYQIIAQNPWRFFFAGLLWYFLAWTGLFLMNFIWPVLLLIFQETARLRNPKVIIQVGERFRKMGLSSPQIYSLVKGHDIWKNKVNGFFAIPSPFGALLLIGHELSEKLDFEKFDHWICHIVIESRFYKYSRTRFLLFSILPTTGLFGLFLGHTFFVSNTALANAAAALMLLLSIFFILKIYRQRVLDIDFRTIRNFHLEPEYYFQVLGELRNGSISEKILSIANRKTAYELVVQQYEDEISIPSWKPIASSYAVIFASCLICFAIVAMFDQKYSQEFTVTSLLESIDSRNRHNVVAKSTSIVPDKLPESIPAVDEKKDAEAKSLSPMTRAVLSGDIRQVIRAMGTGIHLDFRDQHYDGATPILLAIKNGDLEMVYMLLALGAKFSDVDSLGRNALFYALEAPNRLFAVRYALSGQVNPNQKSSEGKSVLDLAKERKILDVIQLLESSGAISTEPPSKLEETDRVSTDIKPQQ